MDVVKITIKGSSGFLSYDETYTDKVIITPDSISYEYKPAYETDVNPKRKWSYKTSSPIFAELYKIYI